MIPFQPFRVFGKKHSRHRPFKRMGYAEVGEKIINGLGATSHKNELPAFSRTQIGNCCGLVCIYGVGGDVEQFEFCLDKAIFQSGNTQSMGAGALFVALPRGQVERYHLSLIERGFEVIFGCHNSNYPHDEADNPDAPVHDILLYAMHPQRSYDQKRDWKNAEFIQED